MISARNFYTQIFPTTVVLLWACLMATALAQTHAAERACHGRANGEACSFHGSNSEPVNDHKPNLWGHCFELERWADGSGGVDDFDGSMKSSTVKVCLQDGTYQPPPQATSPENNSTSVSDSRALEMAVWVAEGGWIVIAVISPLLCCTIGVCMCVWVRCLREESSETTFARMPVVLGTGLQNMKSARASLSAWRVVRRGNRKGRGKKPAASRPVAVQGPDGKGKVKSQQGSGGHQRVPAGAPPPVPPPYEEPDPEGQNEGADDTTYDIEAELRAAALDDTDLEIGRNEDSRLGSAVSGAVAFNVEMEDEGAESDISSDALPAPAHLDALTLARRAAAKVAAEDRASVARNAVAAPPRMLTRVAAPDPLRLPSEQVPRLGEPPKPVTPVSVLGDGAGNIADTDSRRGARKGDRDERFFCGIKADTKRLELACRQVAGSSPSAARNRGSASSSAVGSSADVDAACRRRSHERSNDVDLETRQRENRPAPAEGPRSKWDSIEADLCDSLEEERRGSTGGGLRSKWEAMEADLCASLDDDDGPPPRPPGYAK